jgi:hypothetical protein
MTSLQRVDYPGQNKVLINVFFYGILLVYFADCFTPLRLHVDTVRYYLIKDCIEFGCPPDSEPAKDYFPYGYTALLLIFSKLGILTSFSMVLINSIYLVAGLYFLQKAFKQYFSFKSITVIVLINWLFVKFVAHPLSEMQYVFFSLTSIYCYCKFLRNREFKYFLFALLLGWIAFMTRTIGITLIGALVCGLLWEYKEQQIEFFKKNKVLVICILLILVTALILLSEVLGINHYAGVLSEHFKEASLTKRIAWRFKEWGELFINVPSNKIIDRVTGRPGEYAFMLVGLAVFGWFMFQLFKKGSKVPVFIRLYLLFYCLIMFNWPFNDPRFWVPVMPVMAAVVLQASYHTGILKWLKRPWLVVYLALGLFASGYMVYTSFNKKAFVVNQARGDYKNEYEIHFYGKPQSDTAKKINPDVISILKRYD